MAFPEVTFTTASVLESPADAIVLVIPALASVSDDDPAWAQWPDLKESLAAIGFTGKLGSTARVYAPASVSTPLMLAGAGPMPSSAALRFAAGSAMRALTGFATVSIAAPFTPDTDLAAMGEGAGLGATSVDGYRSEPGAPRASAVSVHTAEQTDGQTQERVLAAIRAIALVKELVATPAAWLGPEDLADRARAEVEDLGVSIQVWDEKALEADGFGGILGVGQGSVRPPRLVRLDYAPADSERHISLVGKGITFDSGGLSLKPAGSMIDMKYDMCGAATVLAVVRAVAQLKTPVHLTGWLCIADNMPSGSATRPGDVLRIADGTTVEVLNTDAEGRLVLADGLVAASREIPDLIIDVATLTGAITTALGTRHVGVMGADSAVQQYLDAAVRADELAWPLPLPEHMREELDSPIADLRNAKVGDPAGGSLFAGLFLQHFVGTTDSAQDSPRIPWVHLDIAGVGLNKSGGYGFTDKGPTGATTRTLIELITTTPAG